MRNLLRELEILATFNFCVYVQLPSITGRAQTLLLTGLKTSTFCVTTALPYVLLPAAMIAPTNDHWEEVYH